MEFVKEVTTYKNAEKYLGQPGDFKKIKEMIEDLGDDFDVQLVGEFEGKVRLEGTRQKQLDGADTSVPVKVLYIYIKDYSKDKTGLFAIPMNSYLVENSKWFKVMLDIDFEKDYRQRG